jgi:hypothetical protein
LRLDGFLSQKILCLNGEWVSRAATVKYIANVAHGVHSGDAKEKSQEIIRRMRHMMHLSLEDQRFNIDVWRTTITRDDPPLILSRDALDIASFQLASTAQYLLSSPSVLQLEEFIRHE